jgi:tetratricopeptide (TPR) repeat protein
MSRLDCIRRPLACFAAALALCLGAPLTSAAAEIGLAPIEADPSLSPIASGFGAWLEVELAMAGHEAVSLSGPSSEAGVRAAEMDLARILVTRLREDSGRVRIQLVIQAARTHAPLAGVRRTAPIAELGAAAAEALETLLPQLGGSRGRAPLPPQLEDLASSTVAVNAWAAGDLIGAWTAVEGKLSPVSMSLREQILQVARQTSVPAPMRARVMAASGDVASAWSLIRRDAPGALASGEPDPALLLAAGEVLLKQGDAGDARAYFDRVLEMDPRNVDAALGLAQVIERQGDPAGARRWIEEAVRIDPDDPALAERLAELHSDPSRAAEHWIEAGRRSVRRLDPQRARTQLERAASLAPDTTARVSVELGALEARLGRPAEALVAYRRARNGGVGTPAVLTAIGRAHRELGATAESERALRSALEVAPDDVAAQGELGVLYADAGRYSEAVELLRAVHGPDPHNPGVRRGLARALRATGDTDEALALLSGTSTTANATDLGEAASIHLERGDLDAARDTLNRAIALAPDDPDLRGRHADLLEASGDAESAGLERQRAAALDAGLVPEGQDPTHSIVSVLSLDDLVMSFAEQVPRASRRRVIQLGVREPTDWKSRAWQVLRPHAPDSAALGTSLDAALEARFLRVPMLAGDDDVLAVHIDQLYDFESDASLNAGTIATLNQVLATDATLLTRLIAHGPELEEVCGPDAFAVEMRLLSGQDEGLVSILTNFDCLEGGFAAYGRWNAIALGLYAILALALSWPLLRGWGGVQVLIKLPDKTKGFFSIHITTKPDQVKREQVDKKTKRKKTRARGRLDFLKRFERHMAGRETTFRWIPARKGSYTVTVAGPLLDARGEEIIGHFLEEQRVRVRRGRATVLEFDFRPKECAVEVRVSTDGQAVQGARVAVRGDPASLRYARDGVAFIYLGLGSYTLLVGSHDAAGQFDLDISSLDNAIPLHVDLGNPEGVLFSDCPEAVDAFLQSDLETAAQALDAAGNEEAAHLVRADFHRLRGHSEEAARELEAAGRLGGAAELRAGDQDFEGSASLFEQAGDHAQAADAYRAAGDWTRAARCYEQAYDWGNALECWREIGDPEREMIMLEKLGEFMDAAAVARERGDRERALRNLQQIDARHQLFGEACRGIAELAIDTGEYDFAVSKLEEGMASLGAENASVESLEVYAQALEHAERPEDAMTAWEKIRRRDAARTDVAERINDLKRRIGSTEATQALPASEAPKESRYELIEEIGRGGMGVVFKARDKRLGRIVALKKLPNDLRDHPTAVALFEREARAAAALNHLNIVTLFDAGEEDGAYFITMELLEGKPLNAILARRGRVSPRAAARVGTQICAGLQYAHERRIVHRDIKTANLFLTVDHTVKIMDFGIAKSLEEVRRSTTVIGGTPYYMAPEQAAGEAVDHRADLYALGVTFFQLVTGSLPFADGDVSYRHRHEAPPDPREVNVEVPAPLAQLILALMSKDPENRPGSAAVVGASLAKLATRSG